MIFPWLRDVVTLERARVIKGLRCDGEGETWRGVAYECYALWGSEHPEWTEALRGNQFVGRDLCEIASELLGERVD